MFPYDAISVYRELLGPTTYLAVPTTTISTVLNVRMQQSGTASETSVKCGTTTIALNYAKDFAEVNSHTLCKNKAIYFSKTGNDSSFLVMTYVPYNVASSTSIGPSYGDFMFTASVIIALLSIIMWRLIFKK